ncbi:MAG: hypothetical protein V2J62_07750, partial [candidate division KSB1 bacterium]|nr:hypothetical protein [candidate division KSB1 bacterium]
MRVIKLLLTLHLTFSFLAHPSFQKIVLAGDMGQEEENTSNAASSNERILLLEQELERIKEKLEKRDKEDQLQKLLDEANKLKRVEKKETSGIGKKFRSGTRKQSGLNPNISVGGDFFFGVSSSKANVISEPSDISYGNNRFELREMEVAFVAPLDPFTRGKSFISVQQDAIAIEEAYMEWLNLPLNLNLKAGIFYSDFGILNR